MSYKPPHPTVNQVPAPERAQTPLALANGRRDVVVEEKATPPSLRTSSGSCKHQINGFSPRGLEPHADRNGEIRAMELEGRAETTAQWQACSSGSSQSAAIDSQAI